MANNLDEHQPNGQVNPGQTDPEGNEVVIKKNEGISDQGNEWADQEGTYAGGERVLGEKAEKYMNKSADIEDLPDAAEEQSVEKKQG